MFRRLDPARPKLRLSFEGQPLDADEGDTVAAALLAAGIASFRTTPVSGAARGPWCLMGVCFDCLVEIDGKGSVQGCLTPVRAGMRVARQQGRRSLSA
jgi:predicted molibdopterin-dependent oxidoreductase YjgC